MWYALTLASGSIRLTSVRASIRTTRKLSSPARPHLTASTCVTVAESSTAIKSRSGNSAACSIMNSPLPAPISISTGARRPKIAGGSIVKTRSSGVISARWPISRALGSPQIRAAFRSLAIRIVQYDDTVPAPSPATHAAAGCASGSVGALQESTHAIDQRLQVGTIDQRTRHPDRIAEEKALIKNLPAAECAARDLPRQSIKRDALFGGRIRGCEVALDIRHLGGICEVARRRCLHQRARTVELDNLDHARIQPREKIARGVERRSRRREHAPLVRRGVSFGGAQARAHRFGGRDHLGQPLANVRQLQLVS